MSTVADRQVVITELLKAEVLLKNSYVLVQIHKLKNSLQYQTDGQKISYDDYYVSLQKQLEDLKILKLENVVAPGTENQYIVQLTAALEEVYDNSNRIESKMIHFQSRLANALSQIKGLAAAFEAWYILAATETLIVQYGAVTLPAASIKALAASEFAHIMDNLPVEVTSLLEAVKVQFKEIKLHKKTQQDKFSLGKDQANASWSNSMPAFSNTVSSERSNQLLTPAIEEEEDLGVPQFVSQKPSIKKTEESFVEHVTGMITPQMISETYQKTLEPPQPTPPILPVPPESIEDILTAPIETPEESLPFIVEGEVVVREKDGFPEKVHCERCSRRIRVGQTMFKKGEEFFHAKVEECTDVRKAADKAVPAEAKKQRDETVAEMKTEAAKREAKEAAKVATILETPDSILGLMESQQEPSELVAEETVKALEYTGELCSVCMNKQFNTTSGVTCSEGHGGADPFVQEVPVMTAVAPRKKLTFLDDNEDIL